MLSSKCVEVSHYSCTRSFDMTATHNSNGSTNSGILHLAFELGAGKWVLGLTSGHGEQPRLRSLPAGVWRASRPKSPRPRGVSAYRRTHASSVVTKPGAMASDCTVTCSRRESTTSSSIRRASRSSGANACQERLARCDQPGDDVGAVSRWRNACGALAAINEDDCSFCD
jgi:hypothetical protein